MINQEYPLSGNDLYKSALPQEAIEYFILTKKGIDSKQLQSFEKEDQLFALGILYNQYHLVQYCYSIKTKLLLKIICCDYYFENIDGKRACGNYYVPLFYFNHCNSRGEKSIRDSYIEDIGFLIDQISSKGDIHIGFIPSKGINHETLLSNYTPIKDRLIEKGYTYIDNTLIDDFGFFSWDDSVFSTISVLIDCSSNEEQICNNIRRFLTMDNSKNSDKDFYIGGRLIYISYPENKL